MKKKKTKTKNWELFEPAPQHPPAKKVRPLTTGPCDQIVLKHFSLPFTMFESYGAVFIMNPKIHLRKNSSNEYFKTISHYFRVYSLSGFIWAARLTDWSSSSLLSLKLRSPFFRC